MEKIRFGNGYILVRREIVTKDFIDPLAGKGFPLVNYEWKEIQWGELPPTLAIIARSIVELGKPILDWVKSYENR